MEMEIISLNLKQIENTLNSTLSATQQNALLSMVNYDMKSPARNQIPYEDLDFTPTHDTQSNQIVTGPEDTQSDQI
jgi:hypothetical protein